MKIIFVGFSVKEEKSVLYKKIKLTGAEQPAFSDVLIASQINKAILKGCDFMSLRFIADKEAK